jgi:hypothetical protein
VVLSQRHLVRLIRSTSVTTVRIVVTWGSKKTHRTRNRLLDDRHPRRSWSRFRAWVPFTIGTNGATPHRAVSHCETRPPGTIKALGPPARDSNDGAIAPPVSGYMSKSWLPLDKPIWRIAEFLADYILCFLCFLILPPKSCKSDQARS